MVTLMVAGAGGFAIQATAVDSIMAYLDLCRPLVEYSAFRHGNHRCLATDEWLRHLVAPLNVWIRRNQVLMQHVALQNRMFVSRNVLEQWLLDRSVPTKHRNAVASNLGKIFGARAGCKPTNLFSFCGQTVCS